MAAKANTQLYDTTSDHFSSELDEDVASLTSKNSEEPIGNITDFSAVPVGYNGENKKGNLIFDAAFESGNLGRVDYISDFEYDLFVRPDTCNARFRVWFNFTVRNASSYQRVIFNIVNFSKTKSLYRGGMSPVVKSTSRPKWQRVPSKNVFYYRCPDHRKNYVMSFAFCFDKEEDVYQFAYSYPYTYSHMQKYLTQLQKRNLDYFLREQLCLSVQQRKVDIVTITSKVNHGDHSGRNLYFLQPECTQVGSCHGKCLFDVSGTGPSSETNYGICSFVCDEGPAPKT